MDLTIKALEGRGIYPIDADAYTEDQLNEALGEVIIAGYAWGQGTALKELDPVAFRQEMLNYMYSLVSDGVLVEVEGEYFRADEIDGG